MNKHFRNRMIYLLLSSVLMGAMPLNIMAEETSVEDTFVLVKDTKFHRFFVNKNISLLKYKKLAILPLNYNEFKLADNTRRNIKRNWANFKEDEMPNIAEHFSKLKDEVFNKSEAFILTDKVGEDVLIIQYSALDMTPRSFIDNGLDTVGKESFHTVGSLQYRVALYDARTKAVVAMIEDDMLVALDKSALNNRANHKRAWIRSMRKIIQRFEKEMSGLQKSNR